MCFCCFAFFAVSPFALFSHLLSSVPLLVVASLILWLALIMSASAFVGLLSCASCSASYASAIFVSAAFLSFFPASLHFPLSVSVCLSLFRPFASSFYVFCVFSFCSVSSPLRIFSFRPAFLLVAALSLLFIFPFAFLCFPSVPVVSSCLFLSLVLRLLLLCVRPSSLFLLALSRVWRRVRLSVIVSFSPFVVLPFFFCRVHRVLSFPSCVALPFGSSTRSFLLSACPFSVRALVSPLACFVYGASFFSSFFIRVPLVPSLVVRSPLCPITRAALVLSLALLLIFLSRPRSSFPVCFFLSAPLLFCRLCLPLGLLAAV